MKSLLSDWILKWGKRRLYWIPESDDYWVEEPRFGDDLTFIDALKKDVTGVEDHEREALRRGVSNMLPQALDRRTYIADSTTPLKEDAPMTPLKTMLLAFATALAAYAKTPDEIDVLASAPIKGKPGPKPKPKADDGLGEDDGLGDTAEQPGSDGLGEDDGLGNDAPPAAPTQDDVRKALLGLKAKDGDDNTRANAIMKLAIGEGKPISLANIPKDKYKAVLDRTAKVAATKK